MAGPTGGKGISCVCLPLPWLTVVLTAGVAACAVLLWRAPGSKRAFRAVYSLYALVALAFVPYLAYYNLFGFGQ